MEKRVYQELFYDNLGRGKQLSPDIGVAGSIRLDGHIHTHEEYNLQNKVDGIRRYDVGVDENGYYPVSVKQIIEFFED